MDFFKTKASLVNTLILLILLTMPGLAKAQQETQSVKVDTIDLLITKEPTIKEIKPKESHNYQLTIPPNTFLWIEVVQKSIPIDVIVYNTKNELVRKITYQELHLLFAPIYLFSLNEQETYRIEISGAFNNSKEGIYLLKLVELEQTSAKVFRKEFIRKELLGIQGLVLREDEKAYLEAINRYKKVLAECEVLGLEKEQLYILGEMADLYKLVSDLDNTLLLSSQGLALAEKLGEPEFQGRRLAVMAMTNKILGNYDLALEYFQKAIESNKTTFDSFGAATTLNAQGALYISLGEPDKALAVLESAVFYAQQMQEYQSVFTNLNNIGVAYGSKAKRAEKAEKLRLLEKTIEYFERALAVAEKNNYLLGQGSQLTNMGRVYEFLENYNKSVEMYKKALLIHQQIGDKETEAITLSNIALSYQYLKKYDLATNFYSQALLLHRALNLKQDEATTLQRIYSCQMEQGNLLQAKESIEKALSIMEGLHKKILMQDLKQTHFSVVNELYKNYVVVLMALDQQFPNLGYSVVALEASENSRARTALELLAQSDVVLTANVRQSLIEEEKSLKEQIEACANSILREPSKEKVTVLEKNILNLESQLEEIDLKVKQESGYGSVIRLKFANLKEIQQKLDENTILLEYCLAPKSYVWVITNNSINSVQLASNKEINKQAQKVYEKLKSRNLLQEKFETRKNSIKDLNNELSLLSQLILAPIENFLKAEKKLLIVADESLHYIPFSVLPKIKSKEPLELLIQNHEVINLISASISIGDKDLNEYVFSDNEKSATTQITLVGDPIFTLNDERIASGKTFFQSQKTLALRESTLGEALSTLTREGTSDVLPRLKFTGQEVKSISSTISQKQTKVLVGFDANINMIFREKYLEKSKLIHFATHGLLSPNPNLSGVVLSLIDKNKLPVDGFLSTGKILGLKLDAELVVLSACQTALGKEIKGEGLLSVGRAFVYAGAKRVITSLWRVDDEATSELMIHFYRNLKRNMSASAALRQSQLEIMKDKRWQSTYFWGGFILQGQAN